MSTKSQRWKIPNENIIATGVCWSRRSEITEFVWHCFVDFACSGCSGFRPHSKDILVNTRKCECQWLFFYLSIYLCLNHLDLDHSTCIVYWQNVSGSKSSWFYFVQPLHETKFNKFNSQFFFQCNKCSAQSMSQKKKKKCPSLVLSFLRSGLGYLNPEIV